MINRVAIMGRLTKTPELKTTESGLSITSFDIAVDGYKENQVYFFTVVCFQKNAEFVTRYFSKGQMIVIDGHLQTREHKGRKYTEIFADTVHFGGRDEHN